MPTVIWTVLPNGVDGQNLKVSLFVSLRLDSGMLSSSFAANWTQLVHDIGALELVFDTGGARTNVSLNIDKSLLVPHLWTGIFPTDATTVQARAPQDLTKRPLVSYSVREMRTTTEDLYRSLASQNPTAPPLGFHTGEGESPPNTPSSAIENFIFTHGSSIATFERTGTHPDVRNLNDANLSPYYRALRFYRRDLNLPPPAPMIHFDRDLASGSDRPTTPNPDFHQALGMLGDQPALLRRLGLIIDGTVKANAVPSASNANVALVKPTASQLALPAGFSQGTPFTAYTRDSGQFLPRPNPNTITLGDGTKVDTDLQLGLLKLADPNRFEIQQLDTDGSALKVGNYAVMMANKADTNELVLRSETPHLKTAGVMIARVDRRNQATARLGAAAALEPKAGSDLTDTVLFADDVLRGYRPDVRAHSNNQWRSLTKRTGSYLVGAAAERVPNGGDLHDEGYVKASGASSHADQATTDPSNPLYIHEALVEWNGWSPVIPPPGKSIVFNPDHLPNTPADSAQDAPNKPPADATIKVQSLFKVEPGTLPKLRFGETYDLRMRAVDLAGNSLPLNTTVNDASTIFASIQYRRYEPVPTPVLVLRQPVIEGESVEHIVIRSRVGTPGLPGNLFFATNDRHVAPASASLDTAITHGMLDPFFNDPNRSFNIGLKSDGSFLDQTIIDIRNGHSNPAPGVQIVNGPEVPPGSPTFPAHPGDGLLPGQYVIHTENKLELPYLPDPIAAGVALGDVPPNPADLTVPGASPNPPVGLQKMFFEGTWPLLEPNKIVVTATNGGAPTLDMKGDDFVVGLPPATILRLRLSSLIRQADLQNMAIWNLLSAADQTRLLQGALDGQHWLISPWREIVATHAVNKPLAAATFTALTVSPDRQLGETFAVFQGTIQNHSHSTGQLDMQASWSDRVDRLTDPAPTDEPHSGKVKSFRPAYDDSSFTIPTTAGFLGDPRPRHDFGDTKHRYVDYRADATTRYLENFPAGTADNPSDVMVTGLSTRINILSTARPDKPQILYIVPTFRWEVQDHGKTSTRVGRGLRVYLARPWFSTGIDELLGVLIPQNPAIDAADDAAEGFISEWGSDPVWDTGGPTTNLVATDFLNSLPPPADPLSIKEKPTSVRVVPFPVTFDTDRQVWFADIEMRDTGSYFPFVRLALSRYQPFSITDAALSPVVRADFVQLVNDRSATAFTQPGSVHVSVTGVAGHNRLGADIVAAMLMSMTPAPSAPPGFVFDASAGAGRLVTAHIEQRRRQDGDLDWLLVSDVVVLASFSPSGGAGPGVPVLWDGSVPSPPRGHANGDQEFRLVIREIEIFDTDPDTAESVTIALPMGRSAVRGRVAYLDVLPLDDPDKW